MAGTVTVVTISVNSGTAVLVIAACTIPTLNSYPTIKTKAQWPAAFTLTWRWANGTSTTYTYGDTDHITRLSAPNTNVAVCTLSTATPPSTQLLGYVEAKGTCTASAKFEMQVATL